MWYVVWIKMGQRRFAAIIGTERGNEKTNSNTKPMTSTVTCIDCTETNFKILFVTRDNKMMDGRVKWKQTIQQTNTEIVHNPIRLNTIECMMWNRWIRRLICELMMSEFVLYCNDIVNNLLLSSWINEFVKFKIITKYIFFLH